MSRPLSEVDPEIYQQIQHEVERQHGWLELIASENFTSEAVLQATGSVFTNKYAEGYPGKRYYGGCEYTDVVENLARDRAKKLFGAEHANVQPHSGSQANQAAYSAILGVFIPSGGSKWVIEAPYVLQAAIQHQVNLGWVVVIYNAAEALPNLLNPFWMLPLLGLLHMKARDLVGYSVLQMFVHIPLVFFLCWLFAQYIPFIPPLK